MAFHQHSQSRWVPKQAGFTLVEMLAVLAIIAVLIGTIGSAIGSFGAQRLSGGASVVTATMHEARSLALSENTRIRLAIDVEVGEASFLRKLTILKWERQVAAGGGVTGAWVEAKSPVNLPEGVVVEIGRPAYLTAANASYVADDPAVLGGDYIADAGTYLTELMPGSGMNYTFIEYKPSGFASAYLASGEKSVERNIHLVLTEGNYDAAGTFISTQGAVITNWAHLVTDSLTGRIKLYRP